MSRLNQASISHGGRRSAARNQILGQAIQPLLESLEMRQMFAAPHADLGGPYVVAEGSSILINGNQSTDDGSIVSYQWDTNYSAGRGFRPRFTGTKWTFNASDSGSRNIALQVTDNDGQTNMVTGSITISDVAPTLSITAPNNVTEAQSFDITWSYTDPGLSDVVTGWDVDWGDDTTDSYAGNAGGGSHTYSEDGNYVITLTSNQADGQTSITHNITVANDAPVVVASTIAPNINEGDDAYVQFFTPNRASTIEGWVVEWGDGNVDLYGAHVQAATHTYVNNGTYTAVVSAQEPDGGSGSSNVVFNVANVDPTAAITGVPASGVEGTDITVGSTTNDVGSDDVLTYGWTVYRDGQSFTLPGNAVIDDTSFTFTPTDNGSYVIRLTVLDGDGGSRTINSDPIIVDNVAPTGSITGLPVGNINEGDQVDLTAVPADVGAEDTTFTYAWTVSKDGVAYDLPNGTVVDDVNFSFVPRDNGSYIAHAVITDKDSGAVTVNSAAITVDNVDPTADITGEPAGAHEGDTVTLGVDVTDAGEDDTHSYLWSVEKDGNPFTLPGNAVVDQAAFSFVPTDEGDYVVSLTVTDDDTGAVTVQSSTITILNAAPTGAIVGPDDAVEGDSPSFTTDATDAGADDVLTYLWSVEKDGQAFVLPGNAVVDQGTFSFIPTDNGSYTVSVDISDDDGATITRTHVIEVTNVAPTVAITNVPTSGPEGTDITVNSTVADAGTDDVLTYGWSVYRNGQHFVLPGNVVIDGQSFTFTPTDDGSYDIRLTVVDDDNGSTTTSSTAITVTNVNPTGVISGEPVGSINEGDQVDLTVTPSDAGSEDTFTYAWSVTKGGVAYDLPNGTVTDSDAFSFVPRDNGSFIATVVITDDNSGSVSVATAAITVDNVDPTANVAGTPANADEGSTISVSADVDDAGEDDTFTYAWAVEKDGNPYVLPNGTVTDEATFAFVPTDNGSYVVFLDVTDDDNGFVSTQSAAITVDNVAPAGTLTGDDTGDEGATLNYNVAATDAGADDVLTYLWSVEKDGQAFVLPGNAVVDQADFSFEPTDEGNYVVSVTVSDDDGDDVTYTHNVAVANVAPDGILTGVPVSGDEGTDIAIGSTVADAGANDTISYAWSVTKEGVAYTLPGNVVTNTGSFTFTPRDNGAYRVTLTLTDNDNGTRDIESDLITVNNVAPTAVISGEPVGSIDEGVQVDLTATGADAGEDDGLIYAWSITKDGQAYDAGANVALDGNTLSFVPNDNGTYVASLTITDDDGGHNTYNSLDIVVDNVNPTASITGVPFSTDEGSETTVGSTIADDGAADTHTYLWSVEKDGQAFTLPNGTVTNADSFTFTPTDNGDYVLTLVVTDDDAGSVTTTSSTIIVDNVNPAPVISGNSSVNEASSITLTAAANDVGADDTHTYLWSVEKDGQAYVLPGGVVTNTSSFTFTPSIRGSYVVSCVVTDDDFGQSTATHNLTVNNLPPVVGITGTPAGPRGEGSPLTFNSTAVDPGGDLTLTRVWSVTRGGQAFALPGGTDTSSSTFEFTPTDNGTYVVTLAVTDSGGATGTASTSNITITNALPSASMTGVPVGSIVEGDAVSLGVTAEDPASEDTLTYAWSVTKGGVAYTLPGGTVTNGTSFDFTPTDNGTYVVTCLVTDDDGGPTTVTSGAITVTNANPTGSIGNVPQQSVLEGQLVALTSSILDAGSADTLTYLWSVQKDGQAFTLPGGAVTNGTTFSFTPTDNGSYVVSLTVTDDDAGSVTVNSGAIVATNVAPTGTISGPATSDEGSAVTATVSASDAGAADTLTYLWSVEKDGQAFTLADDVEVDGSALTFVPADEGEYVLTCVVTDNFGADLTLTHTVEVANVDPTIGITDVPSTGNEGTAITVNSTVTDPGTEDTLTYGWTVRRDGNVFALPDGTVMNGQSLTFTPTDNGNYSVRLTVLDNDGGSTTVNSAPIAVANVKPAVAITGAPTSSDEGVAISLGSTVTDVSTEDTSAGFTYAWTVKRGNTTVKTGTGSSLTFTPTVHGTLTVTLAVTDKDAGTTTTSASTITVNNVAPHDASIVGMPDTMNESGVATLTGSAQDVSNDPLTYSWNITRNGTQYATATGASFDFSPHARGDYAITLTATDSAGATTSTSVTKTVANVAPTGSFISSGSDSILLGETATFNLNVADYPPSQDLSVSWNFGDNQTASASFTGSQIRSRTHTYAAPGSYTVTATISDGVDTTVVTKQVVVATAALRTDPLDSTKTALVVNGTSGNDVIKVEPGTGGKWKATVNGVVQGSEFAPTGHVVVYGNGGSNNITVDGSIDALVFAGDLGGSVLTGSGNDVIFGSPGHDWLGGMGGRDIIFGGAGKDSLVGDEGEDLLVSDPITGSSDIANIKTAIANWNSNKTLAERIADEKATGIFSSAKIVADGQSDQMYGGARGDWMVINSAVDKLRDYQGAFDVIN